MRPVASTCKVGTRFKGFVVKTRKANQHSNRRVKYWAKVATSKPKPKKASTTPKTTRKAPTKRRKLMGGGKHELNAVMLEVEAGGEAFIEATKCDSETAKEIQKIGKRAHHAPDNINKLSQIRKDYEREVRDTTKRPRLNALAIVMANISNAKNSTTEPSGNVFVKDMKGKTMYIEYDPLGDIYDQIQARYPVFINRLVFEGVPIERGTKCEDVINGKSGHVTAV